MDTKNLSREQKEELFKLLQKKALLKQERILEDFKPHKGQQAFLESPNRIRALFSGNGFGKTTAAVIDLIWTHLGRHPHRDTSNVRHSWLLISGFDKAEDFWSEIKKWCPPSQLPTPNKMGTSNIRRFEWRNGSITTIYSHDQDPDKLEGTNIDALYCDEPPPRSLWIASYRGLRNNPDYHIVIAATPRGAAWMYEDLYQKAILGKDPNIAIFGGSTYDNPHLDKRWIKEFESQLTEDQKRERLYGEFTFLQGRVFKEFSRYTHVFKNQAWPTEWPIYCAIDPHVRKPHCVVYLGVTNDDILVVLDELKIDGTVDALAEAMQELEKRKGYKIACRRIDNSGSGTDWNRDSVVAHLDRWSRENNYNVRVSPMRKVEKDVEASINKIRLLLKQGRLRFLDNCVNMISDMELYAWQDHRNPETAGVKEQPRKVHDDFVDPLRYIVASNPVHSPSLSYITTFQGESAAYNKDYQSPRKPPSAF